MSYNTGFYKGRLGIGLTSSMGMGDGNPRYPLDINGDIRLTGSILNANGQVLSLVPAEQSNWSIGNNNLSYTAGNVGIGTTNPQTRLHVNKDGQTMILEGATSTSGYCYMGLYPNGYSAGEKAFIGYPSAGWTSLVINNKNNEPIQFWTNNTEKMRLDKDGNLDVNGSIKSSVFLKLDNGYSLIWGEGFTKIAGFGGSTGNITFQTNSLTRMKIDSDGNVGIGTTSPGAKLEIESSAGIFTGNLKSIHTNRSEWITMGYGGISTGTTHSLRFGVNNSEKMRIDNAGDVGIGTTDPVTKLHIKGSAEMLRLESTSGTGSTWISFRNGGSQRWYIGMGSSSTNNMYIYSNNSSHLAVVHGGGSVGIGTDSQYQDGKLSLNVGDEGTMLCSPDISQFLWRINHSSKWGIYWSTNGSGNNYYLHSDSNPNQILFIGNNATRAGVDLDNGNFITTGWYHRTSHHNGGLCGSYNSVGSNDYKSNPIYVIGSNYQPSDDALGNMYGIGYTHSNSSFIGGEAGSGWGMYIAADGDARWWCNATTGSTYQSDWIRVGGGGGIYFQSYGGGWNMSDSTWIRAYGGKGIYNDGGIWSGVNGITIRSYIRPTSNASLGGPSSSWGGSYERVSIRTVHGIFAQSGYVGASDERIKKNIIEINDSVALKTLRDISCCWYNYIDETKDPGPILGFIAQQVKKHFPAAVKFAEGFIPNEMRELEDISWEEFTDVNNTKKYKLTTDISDCSGVKYQFYVCDSEDDDVEEEKKEVVGNSDNTFTFEKKWNYVYCYGKEVYDFHTLNKQRLFALNFSATQELDRQQQADKVEIAELKAKNTELEYKVNMLETELAAIKQHLGI